MQQLWLIPSLPLMGFLLLVLGHGRCSRSLARLVGVGSVAMAALVTIWVTLDFYSLGATQTYQVELWPWFRAGVFEVSFGLYLDGLALSMLLVITGVGSLIHWYASGYMWQDPDYQRFFAYMNLFVAAMLVLVLADNLVLLFLGWEGVGLCSFLLIGFWHRDPANGYAARKAFVVTRVGDTAFAIGLFLLYRELGTLDLPTIMALAPEMFDLGGNRPTLIAALLLAGALGKSAQLPLHTWLPDAMAGPTPVSALIHAATMVTAGVYLIARNHSIFLQAPNVLLAVAFIGLFTLLVSGFAALNQTDIKRVLAYSTMSQIGYMFFALGVGAWSESIFHLMTHAIFKALLFLTAGSIILALHHEQDIRSMGGLRRQLPIPFWCFVIGSACLVALPPTSGFFSKEAILNASWQLPGYGPWLWAGGVLGAFITAIYTFRLLFLVFFGPQKVQPQEPKGWQFHPPLIILATLSLGAGWFVLPSQGALPPSPSGHPPLWTLVVAIGLPLLGIGIAYQVYVRQQWQGLRIAQWPLLRQFFLRGWGFDGLYQRLFLTPFTTLAQLNRKDIVDQLPARVVQLSLTLHKTFSQLQNGQLRFYITTLACAAIIILASTLVIQVL
ncbi:MAG: NADH-quinone oxidoreductase subunit L [Gammaproteobacteria bacterium]|jgi:NADH-quinone oxidoreductase subunit L|nr:MAG: NADH-quinone oxidoreductase subunit L [Oceanospirillaceae bacterium UBA2001]|tara:strand:- start:2679 stop:4514 length:1836 start_codon:yes stop_codon:yes gene_type:complete